MDNEIRRIYIADKNNKGSLEGFALKISPQARHDHFSYTDAKQLLDDIKGSLTQQSEVLIVESSKVLSELSALVWAQLRDTMRQRDIALVVRQIPSTWRKERLAWHQCLHEQVATQVMLDVIDNDHKERSERIARKQKAGVEKARASGVHIGRKADTDQYQEIDKLLRAGRTYKDIERELKCSSKTITKAKVWAGARAK